MAFGPGAFSLDSSGCLAAKLRFAAGAPRRFVSCFEVKVSLGFELARDSLSHWLKYEPDNRQVRKMYDELPARKAP